MPPPSSGGGRVSTKGYSIPGGEKTAGPELGTDVATALPSAERSGAPPSAGIEPTVAETNVADLAREFLSLVDPELGLRLADITGFPTLLAELVAAARDAWPDLPDLTAELLLGYLAERVPRGAQLERAVRSWRTPELYLCCACIEGDDQALAAFDRLHWRAVRQTLAGLSIGALAEEVEQQLRQRLFVADGDRAPLLAGYAGLGKLDGWLRVVTARLGRRALEHDKRHALVGDDFLAERVMGHDQGAELLRAKPAYRKAFAGAFRQAMTELEPRQVNMLKLRFADGLGLEKIGAIYRVHHTTIHRQLRALRDRLAVRTRELLMAKLEIGEDDCKSIIRLIQSDFGVTLQSFFTPASVADPPEG